MYNGSTARSPVASQQDASTYTSDILALFFWKVGGSGDSRPFLYMVGLDVFCWSAA